MSLGLERRGVGFEKSVRVYRLVSELRGVGIGREIVGGKKGQEDIFTRFGDGFKDFYLLPQLIGVGFVYSKWTLGKFYLKQIDRIIRTLDEQVDLCSFWPGLVWTMHPACMVCIHCWDTLGLFCLAVFS